MFKGEALGLRAMYGARHSCTPPCSAQCRNECCSQQVLHSQQALLTFGGLDPCWGAQTRTR